MKAFFGLDDLKAERIARVQEHVRLDNLVKGATGNNGKGCAVWCTLNKYEHSAYETEMGVPEWMARLEDTIFENLPDDRSKIWPEEFLRAINVGSDLEQIKTPFIVFILRNTLIYLDDCQFDAELYPEVKSATEQSRNAILKMIEAHESGGDLSAARSVWSAAWSAGSAARSVWSAAESAAWSARSAAESAAWSAAWSVWSAAWSAGSAARSVWSAAESAAWSARSAAESAAWSAESAARSAGSAAESAAYIKYADKLLELIRTSWSPKFCWCNEPDATFCQRHGEVTPKTGPSKELHTDKI